MPIQHAAAIDASDLMAVLEALAASVQSAISDAFGPFYVSGLSVSDNDNELLASVDVGEAWAAGPDIRAGGAPVEAPLNREALTRDVSEAVTRGTFDSVDVDVTDSEASRVALGAVSTELAAGFAIPRVLVPGTDFGACPLAVLVVGFNQIDNVFDLRTPVGQYRMVKGSSISFASGGSDGSGEWISVPDSLIAIYLRPHEAAEVHLNIQVTEAQSGRQGPRQLIPVFRTLELGLTVDDFTPGDRHDALDGAAAWLRPTPAERPPAWCTGGGNGAGNVEDSTAHAVMHAHLVINDGPDDEPTLLPDAGAARLYLIELRGRGQGGIDLSILAVRTYRKYLFG